MQRFSKLFGWIPRSARAVLVACQSTADATRGPLYRRGAPWRTRLCPIDEPGESLSIMAFADAFSPNLFSVMWHDDDDVRLSLQIAVLSSAMATAEHAGCSHAVARLEPLTSVKG
jgi:hypothetical protein